MKFTIKHIFIALISLILASCGEVDKELFSDKDAYFAFVQGSAAITENADENLEISLYLAKSTAKGSVTLEVDTEGFDNPAVEGEDFELLDGKTVLFNGEYYEEIKIKVIDNDITDKDKQFNLVMVSNDIDAGLGIADGELSGMLITIIDDEHPLAAVLGTYTLNWDSPWNGNDLQEINQIFSVEGSDTEIEMVIGYYRDHPEFGLSTKVKGSVDMDAMTISIAYDQETYNDGTHVMSIYGDDETPGGIITDGYLIGDIDPVSGDITFRNPFAIAFTGGPNAGYYEDLYINPVLKK
ncbi:MAG: hypothetical protein MI866_13730 [Bacteroidales bacterium]|nr:hypothetical protein [Bacteroidales bacterium]